MTTTVGADRARTPTARSRRRALTDAAVRLRRAELGDGLHRLAVVDRDVVEADRGAVVALGEADEVLHRPGVVDAPRLLGARVDRVGAGVEVVVDAARDQVGPLDVLVVVDQPDPLPALAEDDPAAVAGVGGQRSVVAVGRGRPAVASVGAAAAVGRSSAAPSVDGRSDGCADGVVAAPAGPSRAAAWVVGVAVAAAGRPTAARRRRRARRSPVTAHATAPSTAIRP